MQKGKFGKKKITIAVSGGFDPVHVGHVRLFNEAKKLGDKLVVILNNDNWLMKKKGFVFMSEKERKEVIEGLRAVDKVVLTKHSKNPSDMSVSRSLLEVRPDIFANGGDRNKKNAADPRSSLYKDISACGKIEARIVYNVGKGGKIQSSSWLVQKLKER
jgi:cytidyltransferase-like protein